MAGEPTEARQHVSFHVRAGVREPWATRPSRVQPEQLRNMNVLVVDDNSTNAAILTGLLGRWGMRRTTVGSGQGGFQALQEAKSARRSVSLSCWWMDRCRRWMVSPSPGSSAEIRYWRDQ